MTIRQGEIYAAFVEGGTSRPVVVVSRDELNRGHYLVCVPFTSQKLDVRRQQRNNVAFRRGEYRLTKDCVAQSEAITILTKADLDLEQGSWGCVSGNRLRELIRAIGYVIAADCEPT